MSGANGSVNDWRVHVERRPLTDAVRVFLSRPAGNGEFHVVCGDGTVQTVPEATTPPDEAGLTLPDSAWRALCEHAAGQSDVGGQVRVLREWLTAEQQRFGQLVDRITVQPLLRDGRRHPDVSR